MTAWNLEQARQTYCLPQWGEGYFDLDEDGDVVLQMPEHAPHKLADLCDQAAQLDQQLPLLLRFPQLLADRAQRLQRAFVSARQATGYQGEYTAVYPIKVNQQHDVVTSFAQLSEPHSVGLEAGSKPELIAALALSSAGKLVICNGYKDDKYIRLALLGQRLGLRVVIVVEQLSELPRILHHAARLNIQPVLGVRLRLTTIGGGNWQNTGGRRAKFGLVAEQLVALTDSLREHDCLDYLQLLHFHMGSQIARLADMRRGVAEAMRYLAVLRSRGAPLPMLDVGGGIGVDYEGNGSQGYFSRDYSLESYARGIVEEVQRSCNEQGLAHPHLITEAGRAMTAHHAVLVTQVSESESMPGHKISAHPDPHPLLRPLVQCWQSSQHQDTASADSNQTLLREAEAHYAAVQEQFVRGALDLHERAAADDYFYATLRVLRDRAARNRSLELFETLNLRLADKYFCNFSVFQSLPDVWGLGQVFPILPLTGLREEPDAHAVLEDLTCDSDGRIDQFISPQGLVSTLPVHPLPEQGEYRLGIFLVGAYQETLGDIHNLFGDTDVVNVWIQGEQATLKVSHGGDSAADLLSMVGYEPQELVDNVKKMATKQALSASQQEEILTALRRGLNQGTYLKSAWIEDRS